MGTQHIEGALDMPEEPLPYDFHCAHCGKHLKGVGLPVFCPRCNQEHTHRIGAHNQGKTIKGVAWLDCAIYGCKARIRVDDLPNIDHVGSEVYWEGGKRFTGEGQKRGKSKKR